MDRVIDQNIYYLGRDTEGNLVKKEELHEVLLSLILEFDRICRKNNIPYAMGFGSALGMYNYGGFIPWDDDADAVINYEDIYRLIEAFKKDLNTDEFTFDCYEDNPKYCVIIPTFKLRKKNTYVKEKSFLTLPNKCQNGDGVYLDIVAFMGVPSDEKKHYELIKVSKRKMLPYVIFDGLLRIDMKHMKQKLKDYEKNVYEQYKDSPVVSQTVIIPFQNWSDEVNKLSWPRDVIYPFKEYDFEGHKIYSFNKLKEYCILRYGEKSLRQFDGEKWIDPYNRKGTGPSHFIKFSLKHNK